jgi:hypothetical protein
MCMTERMISGMIYRIDRLDVIEGKYPKEFKEFEATWGSMSVIKNYIHFLLKYMYTANWDREVKENYLSNSMEKILALGTQNGHRVVYQKHYTLDYLKKKWHDDFGVNIGVNTHLKLILSK